jgi:moderate conductance mechanosensitive channel
MIVPRTFSGPAVAYFLLAASLALSSLSSRAWAGTTAAPEPAVSVAELERLAQQIDDPEQRAQLLKTLQALIVVARQEKAEESPQKPGLDGGQSQRLFLAFGEFTQHIATISRSLVQSMAALPAVLGELPERVTDPAISWFALYLTLSVLILVAFGIILQLIANRVEQRFRSRFLASDRMSVWRKVWLSMITIGMAVAPYVALLIISGVAFSILPLGTLLSGLVALFISTCLLYQFVHAVVLVILNPDQPSARLLPIRDSTAQQAWNWVVRLCLFAAGSFLITHMLLTVGVTHMVYHGVRGLMLLAWAIVLSALVLRLTQLQRAAAASPTQDLQPRRWTGVVTTLQRIWPIIALIYIWCTTLQALFSPPQSVTPIAPASLQMAVVIAACLGLLWGGEHLFTKVATLNDKVGGYLPGLEVRTLRYLRTLWWSIRMLIIAAAVLLILQVWGVDMARFFASPLGSDVLSRLITLLVTVAVVLFITDLSTFISQRIVEPAQGSPETSKKRRTLVPLTATVVKYAALSIGGLVVLQLVGINITPILAGVGILGLAVGFGAQTLVKDIINGLFILVEDSISVGDVVNIRNTGGLVEAVNLRTIRLRDLQGSVHIIPNSQVEMITNMTKDYSYYVLDVGIAYREDTDEVVAALQEIDTEMRADPAFAPDMLEPIEILGVERFADSAVVIRARLKTKPIRQWTVGREFNRRMKKLFDARGIEIPFPHHTIYWGEPKRGAAAAPQLHIDNQETPAHAAGLEEQRTLTRPAAEPDRR